VVYHAFLAERVHQHSRRLPGKETSILTFGAFVRDIAVGLIGLLGLFFVSSLNRDKTGNSLTANERLTVVLSDPNRLGNKCPRLCHIPSLSGTGTRREERDRDPSRAMPPGLLYTGDKSFFLFGFFTAAQLFTVVCGELFRALLANG
jgi:hypothetical protein